MLSYTLKQDLIFQGAIGTYSAVLSTDPVQSGAWYGTHPGDEVADNEFIFRIAANNPNFFTPGFTVGVEMRKGTILYLAPETVSGARFFQLFFDEPTAEIGQLPLS